MGEVVVVVVVVVKLVRLDEVGLCGRSEYKMVAMSLGCFIPMSTWAEMEEIREGSSGLNSNDRLVNVLWVCTIKGYIVGIVNLGYVSDRSY